MFATDNKLNRWKNSTSSFYIMDNKDVFRLHFISCTTIENSQNQHSFPDNKHPDPDNNHISIFFLTFFFNKKNYKKHFCMELNCYFSLDEVQLQLISDIVIMFNFALYKNMTFFYYEFALHKFLLHFHLDTNPLPSFHVILSSMINNVC